MPNWCFNGLTLRHTDPTMIDRVIKGKDGLLMEFLPTPPQLKETLAGSYGDEEQNRKLYEQQEENIRQFGYKDWYDWNVANWGTKWDISLENVERIDSNTVTAGFDSAWSPPIEAYRKLVELGFDVDAKYYEPGMAFCGTFTNEDDEDTINLYDLDADNVREVIGEELDDFFGISDEMAQYQEEEEE